MFHLLLQPLLGKREVTDIGRVGYSEFRRSFEKYISDTLDDRCLLPLPDVHDLQQPAVTFSKIEDVVENLVNKFVNFTWSDDRRSRCSKGTNEKLDDK